MRALAKITTLPPTFSSTGDAGARSAQQLRDKKTAPSKELSFPAYWNRPDSRGLLYANQWRVCAYCARLLPGNDRGDVEHFRPKKKVSESPDHGGYWWLAYKMRNYLLSCGGCNSHRKGNKFPLRNRANHITFKQRARISQEARALLNPIIDPVESLLTVDIDDRIVPVVPVQGITKTQRQMAETTIDFFRLNKDRSLVDDRVIVLDHVTEALENNEFDRARALAVRYSPHSLVAKATLERLKPDLLPNKEEELTWLLDKMLAEVDTLLEILELNPNEKRCIIELNEALWAFAILHQEPPDGDRDRIRDVLQSHALMESVEEILEKL